MPALRGIVTIDEAGYADIVQQVRGQEFDRELESRLKLAEDDKAKAVELARQKANSDAAAGEGEQGRRD